MSEVSAVYSQCEMSVVSVVFAVGLRCQQLVHGVCSQCQMSMVKVVSAVGVRCQQ